MRLPLFSLWMPVLAAALFSFAPAKAQDDTAFLAGIEDVPLMDGLTEDTEAGVVFDKAAGRIVEAVAAGEPEKQDVIDFYRKTLPELGWKVGMILSGTDSLMFQREEETLTLTLTRRDGLTVVRYSLAPIKTP